MKTQNPNVHQYLNDILIILSQRISGDLMNTKDKQHIDFISFNVQCQNIYTHVHISTATKWAFSASAFEILTWLRYKRSWIIVLLHEFSGTLISIFFNDYEWFPWSICNGYGMPAGNAYPSGHLVPSPIVGLACAPIVETRFLELAMSLLDFSPRIPLGTFSILLN